MHTSPELTPRLSSDLRITSRPYHRCVQIFQASENLLKMPLTILHTGVYSLLLQKITPKKPEPKQLRDMHSETCILKEKLRCTYMSAIDAYRSFIAICINPSLIVRKDAAVFQPAKLKILTKLFREIFAKNINPA